MRIRTTLAAATATCALALGAFGATAAQAAPTDGKAFAKPTAASRFGTAPAKPAKGTSRAAAETDIAIQSAAVHGGADIVLGTTDPKTIKVAVTASHPEGIEDAYMDLWHGTDLDHIDGLLLTNESAATCTASSATTSKCVLSITVDPRTDLYMNALAGTWHVTVGVLAHDGTLFWDDYYTTHHVQRLSRLTVDGTPEPVKKGGTLTVTGKLSRANWEDYGYHGYTGQPVQLQFRDKASSTYSTVKTVTTNSTGNLSTTVKASATGYWRWSFAGTTTTPAVKAAGDGVNVS